MSEEKDYTTLYQRVYERGVRISRVENIRVDGTPDVNLCSHSVESWIEIKSPKEPKRKTTKLFGSNHKLSTDQKNWFLSQRNAGGIGYILIATDKRWMLIDGIYADEINDLTVTELEKIACWKAMKPITKENWEQLRNKLKNANATI